MAYYDALVTKWGTLSPGTTDAKLAQINAITVAGPVPAVIVPAYKIYNAIDPTEFVALTAGQQQRVRDILSMGTVDASSGTNVRAVLVSIFSNASGPTRIAFAAFLASIETVALPWWQATIAQGGGALREPVGRGDLINAGNLT